MRGRLTDMLDTMCLPSASEKLEQILLSICKPTEVCKPLLSNKDVQPYVQMMFSQAPPMPQVLGGLQELRKVPSIIAEGRFKTIVMSVSPATPGDHIALLAHTSCVQPESMMLKLVLFAHAPKDAAQTAAGPEHACLRIAAHSY